MNFKTQKPYKTRQFEQVSQPQAEKSQPFQVHYPPKFCIGHGATYLLAQECLRGLRPSGILLQFNFGYLHAMIEFYHPNNLSWKQSEPT
eukprot:6355811-Amphidinium_carterae.1